MNELDTRVLDAAQRLELAVKASTEAAQRLLKCAESISNPTYSITMDGKSLEILAVQHFQGQINIQVKSPFSTTAYEVHRKQLEQDMRDRLKHSGPGMIDV